MEYTIRSLKSAVRQLRRGRPRIVEIGQLDTAVGGATAARLNDGSHVYSASYIAEAKRLAIPIGGSVYKTDGVLNQPDAVRMYRDLLLWIKRAGVEPILVLTPYHENVWKAGETPTVIALRATEATVADLARELDLQLIGSYDPGKVGCLGREFYDFMHPTAECLARLGAM